MATGPVYSMARLMVEMLYVDLAAGLNFNQYSGEIEVLGVKTDLAGSDFGFGAISEVGYLHSFNEQLRLHAGFRYIFVGYTDNTDTFSTMSRRLLAGASLAKMPSWHFALTAFAPLLRFESSSGRV